MVAGFEIESRSIGVIGSNRCALGPGTYSREEECVAIKTNRDVVRVSGIDGTRVESAIF